MNLVPYTYDLCDWCGEELPGGEHEVIHRAAEGYPSFVCPTCAAEYDAGMLADCAQEKVEAEWFEALDKLRELAGSDAPTLTPTWMY